MSKNYVSVRISSDVYLKIRALTKQFPGRTIINLIETGLLAWTTQINEQAKENEFFRRLGVFHTLYERLPVQGAVDKEEDELACWLAWRKQTAIDPCPGVLLNGQLVPKKEWLDRT
jgi:hypothetical protein